MPRKKQDKAAPGAQATAPPRADRAFPRKGKAAPTPTHQRIAADLAAFREAGGKVEVLGVTRVLTRVDNAGAAPASKPPRADRK